MYRFSYKVNQRRLSRKIKRQFVREIVAPKCDTSNSDLDYDSDKQSSEIQYQETEQQCFYDKPLNIVKNDKFRRSLKNYRDDETEWISEDDYDFDGRSLYNGSSITLNYAIRQISNFYLDANLDKHKVNSLLRLIKFLLPKPNSLPSTWKGVQKSFHRVPSASLTLLCDNCYHSCSSNGKNYETCVNPKCTTSFRRRETTEIIEIVRFDVRVQIECIMNRNVSLLNKSKLFPPSDICFGEQYQYISNKTNNRISLIVHSDGAPLIRSSKKSVWPCFASIVELPPPVREFQSNIIVLALWVSKKKPDVNIFLDQTIREISMLIHNGTSLFIENSEYKIQLATQFFVSDLPAKALFCCTTYFNGYHACTYCSSRGELRFFQFINCISYMSYLIIYNIFFHF